MHVQCTCKDGVLLRLRSNGNGPLFGRMKIRAFGCSILYTRSKASAVTDPGEGPGGPPPPLFLDRKQFFFEIGPPLSQGLTIFRPSTRKREAGVFQNLYSGQYTLKTVFESLRRFGAFKTRFCVDGRPKRRKVRTLHFSTCEIGTIGSHCNIN